jgi:hypothetical protein
MNSSAQAKTDRDFTLAGLLEALACQAEGLDDPCGRTLPGFFDGHVKFIKDSRTLM